MEEVQSPQAPQQAQAKSDFIVSNGIKFPKQKPFISGNVRGALRKGSYEAREAAAAQKLIIEDDVVIELGAGLGYMSTLIATKTKAAHVHTFEANPQLIPYIRSVHIANEVENVTLHHAILGPRKGTADFYVRERFIASSLAPIEGTNVISVEQVEMRNAKTVFKEVKPTVLVCDIEGGEADLIPAMDLSNLRAAMIELHPQWIGPEGVNAVFAAFISAGMAYWSRGSHGKVVCFRRKWPVR